MFCFLQLCCPCDHFQIFVGFVIFNLWCVGHLMGVLLVGNIDLGMCVCCFVICMQVWVFKSFNYFLLPFPISLNFLVSCKLIVNSTHFVHFFPFYPFWSIFIHFVQILKYVYFIYCLFCRLYLLQVYCQICLFYLLHFNFLWSLWILSLCFVSC